jgi:hypothetical protein
MILFFQNLLSKIELIGKIINITESNCKKLIENLHRNVFLLKGPVFSMG